MLKMSSHVFMNKISYNEHMTKFLDNSQARETQFHELRAKTYVMCNNIIERRKIVF